MLLLNLVSRTQEETSRVEPNVEEQPRVLVITGMHRSGTSLVASLLQRAGVDIGSDLVEPNAGNPRGYFEDRHFLRFHEGLLRHSPHRFLVQDRSELKLPGKEDAQRAKQLLKHRQGGRAWGWKDPRTSLFLDFWADVLPPQARFLFVYRHPIDVVLSLARRGFSSEVEVAADPLVALRAWEVYNRSILRFYRHNTERCFLCSVHSVAVDPAGFLNAVGQRLGMSLPTEGAAELVHRAELSRSYSLQRVEGILQELAPEAMAICAELASVSDLPGVVARETNAYDGRDRNGWLESARRLLTASAGKRPPAGPFLAVVQAMLDPRTKPFRGEDFRAQLSRLEDQIGELRAHAGNLEARHQQDRERIVEITGHAQNLETLLADREGDFANLQAHADNLERLGRQARERVEEIERHNKNLETLHGRARQRIEELLRHAGDLKQLHARDQEQIGEHEAHARNLEQSVEHLSEVLAEVRAHAENLGELHRQDRRQIEELGRHASNLEAVHHQDQKQLEELGQHASNLEAIHRQDREQLKELGQHALNLEALHHQDQEQIAGLEIHANNLETEIRVRGKHLANFVDHGRNLEHVRDQQADQISQLQARVLELEQQLVDRDEALRSSRLGRIPGRLSKQRATGCRASSSFERVT